MVDFIADQPHPFGMAPARNGGQFIRRQHGAGGVAGARDNQSRRARIELFQHGNRWLKARCSIAFQQLRAHPKRLQDIGIGRVEGCRHGNGIAGVKRRQKRQWKGTRSAHGHRDAPRRHDHAVMVQIMPRDTFPERDQPKGFRIAKRRAGIERAYRSLGRATRCAGAGLAHFHANNARCAGRQAGRTRIGGRNHIHHQEGRGLSPATGLQRHDQRTKLPSATPPPR